MQKQYLPVSVDAAFVLLRSLGAVPRLVSHCEIVTGVAIVLTRAVTDFGIPHEGSVVIIGAALHDAGKIVHPEELDGPGNQHEAAGEVLLLDHGVSPEVARICRTHGSCTADMTLEELLVAAADNIWKGSRRNCIESLVIEEIARRRRWSRWEVLLHFDPIFERMAAGSIDRLAHARGSAKEQQTGESL